MDGGAKMGDLIAIFKAKIEGRTEISKGTRTRYLESVDAICKTWPGFAGQAPLNQRTEFLAVVGGIVPVRNQPSSISLRVASLE